ncbi:MAG: hypothetical protein WBM13_13325 [Bacteroidia bacterium]
MLISCNTVNNKKTDSKENKNLELYFDLSNSAQKLNSEAWQQVAMFGSYFLQLPFLKVIEQTQPSNMRFYYATLFKNNLPIAIAYFQLVNFSSDNFQRYIGTENTLDNCKITNYLKKYLTTHLLRNVTKNDVRLLICGNAFISGQHGIAYLPNINKTEIFDAIADVIYEIGEVEKNNGKISASLVKDFSITTTEKADELKEFKYHNFIVEPNMTVNNNWKTFDEYLNAMSKKYRNRAKTVQKNGSSVERIDFSANDIAKHKKTIQELFNNVAFKAPFRMADLSADYFIEMKTKLSSTFNFVAYFYQNQLVGFRTSFITPQAVEAHFIGLNYDFNKELDLYQNMLYDYIQETINYQLPLLSLGRTAAEIKSTVGAEAQQLTCYIKHHNPLSNHLIKPFIDSIKTTEWVPRSPFKELQIQEMY